jgi:hypothetical protein
MGDMRVWERDPAPSGILIPVFCDGNGPAVDLEDGDDLAGTVSALEAEAVASSIAAEGAVDEMPESDRRLPEDSVTEVDCLGEKTGDSIGGEWEPSSSSSSEEEEDESRSKGTGFSLNSLCWDSSSRMPPCSAFSFSS